MTDSISFLIKSARFVTLGYHGFIYHIFQVVLFNA